MGATVYKTFQISEKCLKFIEVSIPILAIALIGLGLVLVFYDKESSSYLTIWLLVTVISTTYNACFAYVFQIVVIDEENDILFMRGHDKYPIRISNIRDIKIKKHSLFIHDNGTYFIDIRLSKSVRMKILEHLKQLNPNVKIMNG